MNNPEATIDELHCFSIFYCRPRVRNQQGNWPAHGLMPDGENWLFAMFKIIPCLCVSTLFLATIISLTHEDTNLALFHNPFKDLPIVNRGHGSSSCFHRELGGIRL